MTRFAIALSVLVVAIACLPAPTLAQESTPSATHPVTIMVETDPVTFGLDGFSLHTRLAHRDAPGWVFGLGFYGLKYPDFFVDLHPDNRNEGWSARIRHAYALFVDYHFSGEPDGLFVGLQVAGQRLEVSNDNVRAKAPAESLNLLAMARLGFLWRPFDEAGFYLLPWVGAGGTFSVGDTRVGDLEYEVFPVAAFGTIHMGWQFD